MSANTPRYDLDTDITLGGSNPSDYSAVSQKAVKYYIDTQSSMVAYGTSNTAADVAEKEVSIPEITELRTGQILYIKPSASATVANLTIKLNNFTAYPIRYNNGATTTSTDDLVWNQNFVSQFIFDGTYWQFAGRGYDNNTTYTQNILFDRGNFVSGSGTYAISRYSICLQKPDMTWEKVTNTEEDYSLATDKTVNTHGFLLNGEMLYYSNTAVLASGASSSANTMYRQYSGFDIRYSMNTTGTGYTAGDYVYFVGTIGVDGLFYLDSTQWWTNTLPSTNDGKIYVKIGKYISGVTVTLELEHPAYYHNGTRICLYQSANNKQDTLVSGTNIKTINNQSLLGSGNITIGGGGTATDVQINGTSITSNNVADIITEGAYNATTNKIATIADIPSIPTVDQTFDGTSANAQSGVAIAGELTNYVQTTGTDTDFSSSIGYIEGTPALQATYTGNNQNVTMTMGCGEGAGLYAVDNNTNEYFATRVMPQGMYLLQGNQHSTLTLSNNNLAINGTEVQTKLFSGINIKTINNTSVLGSGNLDVGTITGITMNGESKGTSGIINLGTVLTEHQDISGKQDLIDATHKLSSDLVDDTNKTNKFVTATEKTTWNAKQDALTQTQLTNIEKGGTAVQPEDISDMASKTWIEEEQFIRNNDYEVISAFAYINAGGNGLSFETDEETGLATTVLHDETRIDLCAPDGEIYVNRQKIATVNDIPVIPTVDQTFDGTSANAQSGVAIDAKLTEYVASEAGNYYIYNSAYQVLLAFVDDQHAPTKMASIQIQENQGVVFSCGDATDASNPRGYMAKISGYGFQLTDVINNNAATLTVSNNNLAVNGEEVATSSAIANMQTTANLVTTISSSSTDTQYPSAKCVYDLVGDIESALNMINSGVSS